MNAFRRLAIIPFVTLMLGAAPTHQVIRPPNSTNPPNFTDWAIIVPSDSLVKFRAWHEYGYAQFNGRFVLSGEFALRMTENCDGVGEACLVIDVKPDSAIAARLPHWNNQGDMSIGLKDDKQLIQSLSDRPQRAALVTGKIPHLTGRLSIVVDEFSAGGDCESAWYAARFVEIAKPPRLARTGFTGDVGCGA